EKKEQYAPYNSIDRNEWKALNGTLDFSLSEEDISKLNALNEPLNLAEIQEVYFPLSHLLNIHINHANRQFEAESSYLNNMRTRSPITIFRVGSEDTVEKHAERLAKYVV